MNQDGKMFMLSEYEEHATGKCMRRNYFIENSKLKKLKRVIF